MACHRIVPPFLPAPAAGGLGRRKAFAGCGTVGSHGEGLARKKRPLQRPSMLRGSAEGGMWWVPVASGCFWPITPSWTGTHFLFPVLWAGTRLAGSRHPEGLSHCLLCSLLSPCTGSRAAERGARPPAGTAQLSLSLHGAPENRSR